MANVDLNLAGQAAVVTGASSGIGSAIAVELAAAGASVVVNHPPHPGSAEKAKKVASQIADAGGRSDVIEADVSSEADVDRMVGATVRRFGRLDVMVANAGIERPAAIHEMELADWRAVLDVNLTGAFLCARAAARQFMEQNGEPSGSQAAGKIIFTSSVHEFIPWAFQSNYAASKGGLMLLMKSLAQELAPMKVRVNSVAPGAIRTPINRESWETPEEAEKLLRLIPYGRIGDPVEVARAVAWLASDASDYVTGTSLVVDGGMGLYPSFRGGG